MHCGSCVSKVQEALKGIEGIEEVNVSLPGKFVSIGGEVNTKDVLNAISSVGYEASLKEGFEPKKAEASNNTPKSELKELFPLLLIFIYISIASIGMNLPKIDSSQLMLDFMGLFYIVFSFFKFLDYKNFPSSFAMYDPIAMRVSYYGWAYPFIETILGILILFRIEILLTMIVTIIMLGITTFGVTKTLLKKKHIQCACLGTALKLPMTKATFIENSVMIIMAISFLIGKS